MINQVQMQLMIDEEERMLKSAEVHVQDHQAYTAASAVDTSSTLSLNRRALTTRRERPTTKEVVSSHTYNVQGLPNTASTNQSQQNLQPRRYQSVGKRTTQKHEHSTMGAQSADIQEKSINLPSIAPMS